jgi:hypothetical protein
LSQKNADIKSSTISVPVLECSAIEHVRKIYPLWGDKTGPIQYPLDVTFRLKQKVFLPSYPQGTDKFVAKKIQLIKARAKRFLSVIVHGEIVPGCDIQMMWEFRNGREKERGIAIIGINSEVFPREASFLFLHKV